MFGSIFGGASMSGSFDTTFNTNFGNNTHQQRAAPTNPDSQQAPPASENFLNRLKETPVTADDLIEESNKECLICFDEHKIGRNACKLPCGHLYHKSCVTEWLKQHCTCPVCRYEVECSDPVYERKRKERMKTTRKLRMRLDEIQSAKISDLRKTADQLGVSIKNCIDKKEIVDLLVTSGKVDIVEGVPIMEIPEKDWMNKTVKELKELLLSFGLSSEEALYKDELRATLVKSGRVSILKTPEQENKNEDNEKESSTTHAIPMGNHSDNHGAYNISSALGGAYSTRGESNASPRESNTTTQNNPQDDPLALSEEQLRTLSIKELKFFLDALSIDYRGYTEKSELVEALSKSKKIRLT